VERRGEGERGEESEKSGHGWAEATRRVGRDCQRDWSSFARSAFVRPATTRS
jgi:hypothetical protein